MWAYLQTAGSRLGLIPAQAVVAFWSESCPKLGWKEFAEGQGRFLIGALPENKIASLPNQFSRDSRNVSLAAIPYGLPGGALAAQLTASILPAHAHTYERSSPVHINSDRVPQGQNNMMFGQDGGFAYTPTTTQDSFPNDPFPLMPPYVAVTLCVKL